MRFRIEDDIYFDIGLNPCNLWNMFLKAKKWRVTEMQNLNE